MTPTRRVSFDPTPLLRQLELRMCVEADDRRDGVFGRPRLPDDRIAAELGVSREQVQRWRHGQRMRPQTAERCAARAGFLPSDLWSDWYDALIAALDQECAADGCSNRFVPAQSNQRFCSVKCRRSQPAQKAKANERSKQYRRGKGAESNRARRRAYYAENAEYEKARQRRYYWQQKEAS